MSNGDWLVEHFGLVRASAAAHCYCQSIQCVDSFYVTKRGVVAVSRLVQLRWALVDDVGIASCSAARRAVIVNLGILEERDEANRLLCMSMGEFDSTDIGHVEWRCACRAASSRSRVGGGLPLSAIGTMCPALARREGRCHCRVAFDAIALVLVCILGIASFSSMRRAVIVNLVILEECDEADRLMCTLAGEFDSNDIGHDEWCCACQAPWARSWVDGGLPLLSFDAMCRVLDWRKGRQCCRVAFGASAFV
jgi:hypothetical protein